MLWHGRARWLWERVSGSESAFNEQFWEMHSEFTFLFSLLASASTLSIRTSTTLMPFTRKCFPRSSSHRGITSSSSRSSYVVSSHNQYSYKL